MLLMFVATLTLQIVSSMQLQGLITRPDLNGVSVERCHGEEIVVQETSACSECLRIPIRTMNGERFAVKLRNIANVTSKILIDCTLLLARKVQNEERSFDIEITHKMNSSKDTLKVREQFFFKYARCGRLIHSVTPIFHRSGWIGHQCVGILDPLEQRIAEWICKETCKAFSDFQ